MPTVRRALIDPLPEVRVAAAKTFDQLHNTIGIKALDDILPDLLKKMVICLFPGLVLLSNTVNQLQTLEFDFLLFQQIRNVLSTLLGTWCSVRNLFSWSCLDVFQDEPSLSEYALDGLRQVMAVKSRVVLPFLVPQVSPHENILSNVALP